MRLEISKEHLEHGLDLPESLKDVLKNIPIVVSDKIMGHDINEKGEVVLGLRCGPLSFDVCALLHELCHLVEIEPVSRIKQKNWGLHFKKEVYVPGRYARICPEPETNQATLRELRVLAYQVNLVKGLGCETLDSFSGWNGKRESHDCKNTENYSKNLSESLEFMVDYRYTGDNLTIREFWRRQKLEEFRRTNTFEKFLERLNTRKAFLKV